MAIFDATVPANSEGVKLGAQRIREVKTDLNAALGQIFDDDTVFKDNAIPGASITNLGITAAQIAAATITTAKLATTAVAPSVTPAAAFFYAAGVYTAGNYAITLAPVPGSYTAGMIVRFLADTANSGAVTINVNSLGVKSVKKFLNVALAASDIALGQAVEVIYDGTNFQLLSPPSTLNTAVYPSSTPAAKAWVKFNGSSAAIADAYNVPSVTRNAVGDYTIHFTTAFSDGDYVVVGSAKSTNENAGQVAVGVSFSDVGSASLKRIRTSIQGSGYVDPTEVYVVFFGDQ